MATQWIKGRTVPSVPYLDIKASELAGLGSDRLSFVGRAVRLNDDEMVVDSVSDIGEGWWRLRLIPPA